MFSSFRLRRVVAGFASALGLFASQAAWADTISPTSFSADLAVGESVTIRKTVTVSKGGPSSALVDIMFVFDTTGSMGGAISNAKATATSLINSLNTKYGGGLFSGVGYYNDPAAVVTQTLTGTVSQTQTAINALFASGGGDYPEAGYAGISAAANSAGWRAGSNRFVVVLGDAGFNNNGGATEASTLAALGAQGIKLIGVDSCAVVGTCGFSPTFANSITGLGGTVYSSGTSSSTLAAAIEGAVSDSFAKYNTVTVSDLGAGLPEIGVSAVCVSADIGSCSGATATGAYDRSVDRTFEFDVTFTRVAGGDKGFLTHALVDKGIVASEEDSFGGAVPEPASIALVGAALLGLGAARRRRTAQAH